jgi:hypothetical protein
MPTYKVTDPETGATVNLTGDSPPTEQELVEIFASIKPQPQEQAAMPTIEQPKQVIGNDDNRMRDSIPNSGLPNNVNKRRSRGAFNEISGSAPSPAMGVIEPALAIASGAILEPVSGLAGIAQTLNPFADEGAGARAVESVKSAAYQPKTKEGIESMEAIADTFGGLTEALEAVDKYAGDSVFNATGSPALAAMATAGPTLALELLTLGTGAGIKTVAKSAGKAIEKSKIKSILAKSAPEIEQLKEAASAVYKELDDSGITIKTSAYNSMVKDMVKQAESAGFSRRTGEVLLPKSTAVIKALEEGVAERVPFTLVDIDNLRKQAGIAAKDINNAADSAVSSSLISSIDDFLDNAGEAALNKGDIPANQVGPKYKAARELWGRAKRAEVLNEAMYKAGNQASGFENGIVTQFRSILNNKKTRNMFKKDELKAIKDVVDGDFKRSTAKLIGKFGFSEGHATGMLGGSVGVAGGAAIGGPVGAVAVPLIGQVSKKLAQRMAADKSNFANQVVRAGKNADEIAKAYMRNTPKSKRDYFELSELLMSPDIELKTSINNQLINDAIDTAKGRKVISAVVSAQAAKPAIEEKKQD